MVSIMEAHSADRMHLTSEEGRILELADVEYIQTVVALERLLRFGLNSLAEAHVRSLITTVESISQQGMQQTLARALGYGMSDEAEELVRLVINDFHHAEIDVVSRRVMEERLNRAVRRGMTDDAEALVRSVINSLPLSVEIYVVPTRCSECPDNGTGESPSRWEKHGELYTFCSKIGNSIYIHVRFANA